MTGHCEHCRQECWGDEDGFHSNTDETVQWDAGHCPNCAERKAIVAWMREAQGSIRWPDEDGIRITRWDGNEFADRIESGEHLRGDDE